MNTIEDVRNNLRAVDRTYDARMADTPTMQAILKKSKVAAVAASNEVEANAIWCVEQILEIQNFFIDAFSQMKAGEFYHGWCQLERAEISHLFLKRHFEEENSEYRIELIAKHVARFQSLFPYKIFMSPEILEIEKRCSICKGIVSIRNPCGHRVGQIYLGELCIREVTKAKFLATAFVETPVQKYSVPFTVDPKSGQSLDQYDYSAVKYVIDRLRSPFHWWEVDKTVKRHPHQYFRDTGRNEPCPCGSGKKYKKCCLSTDGVLRPHFDVLFSVPPAREMLTVEYFGYEGRGDHVR